MARIPTLAPRVAVLDARRVKPPAKTAAPIYHTPDYERWKQVVIGRAGGRCQAMLDDGSRCLKARPHNRMFADHVVELEDHGAPFDPANGQCLCGSHHTRKTAQARAARLARRG